jgi:hypothetical protein
MVEHWLVVPVVAGSSPVIHPLFYPTVKWVKGRLLNRTRGRFAKPLAGATLEWGRYPHLPPSRGYPKTRVAFNFYRYYVIIKQKETECHLLLKAQPL